MKIVNTLKFLKIKLTSILRLAFKFFEKGYLYTRISYYYSHVESSCLGSNKISPISKGLSSRPSFWLPEISADAEPLGGHVEANSSTSEIL